MGGQRKKKNMKAFPTFAALVLIVSFTISCSKTGSKSASGGTQSGQNSTTCTWTDCSGDSLTSAYAVLENDGNNQYQLYTSEQPTGAAVNDEVDIRFNGVPTPGTYTVINDTVSVIKAGQCAVEESNSGIINTQSIGKSGDIVTVSMVPADSISVSTGAIVQTTTIKAVFTNVSVNSQCGYVTISGSLIR